MADIRAVTARVNAVRAACSLAPVIELPKGERGNPRFCPLGRAFRKDPSDSFFLAVGTKQIRLATTDGSERDIAQRIQNAWGVEESKLGREGDQFFTVPLPSELTQFVMELMPGSCPNLKEKSKKLRRSASIASLGGYGM